jgi:hypothetical protein
MRAKTGILLALIALTWLSINLVWLEVAGEQLTGSALSATVNLLPAISLLLIFIASYQRFRKVLTIGSGLALLPVSWFAMTAKLLDQPAALKVIEATTGIIGVGQQVSSAQTIWPWVAAALAIGSFGWSIVTALDNSPRAAKREEIVSDNRSLWDEQG